MVKYHQNIAINHSDSAPVTLLKSLPDSKAEKSDENLIDRDNGGSQTPEGGKIISSEKQSDEKAKDSSSSSIRYVVFSFFNSCASSCS